MYFHGERERERERDRQTDRQTEEWHKCDKGAIKFKSVVGCIVSTTLPIIHISHSISVKL